MFLVDSILVGVSLLCLGANLGSGEFTYDYGTYQSIYKVIPNKLTLADARAACLASGDGWDIGGAYTPAGNTALWNNVIKVSPVLNYFSAYCPSFVDDYRCGPPAARQLSSIVQKADGKWDNIFPTPCTDTNPANYGALCERSPCSFQADCITANSINVTGTYYPNCTCICKPGFSGFRCQINTTSVVYDGREFATFCDRDYLNASVANTRCAAQGEGWALASLTSQDIDKAVTWLTSENFWIGGTHNLTSNKFQWLYGRFAGRVFSSGLTNPVAAPGMHEGFTKNQPSYGDCGDGSPREVDVMVWESARPARGWNDLWSSGCGMQQQYLVRCYACERSLCTMADCPGNTKNVSGYYPSCKCATRTVSATPTQTKTSTPSMTTPVTTSQTQAHTRTFTHLTTSTLTVRPTPTLSRVVSATSTWAPTDTSSPTVTSPVSLSLTRAFTHSPTYFPTLTPQHTPTPTHAPTTTHLATQSPRATSTPTHTPTTTHLATQSPRATSTPTHTPTTTHLATQSPRATSTQSRPNAPRSATATYFADPSAIARLVRCLPLFPDLALGEATLVAGSSHVFVNRSCAQTLSSLMSTGAVPVVSLVPALGDGAVSGNPSGFYQHTPSVGVSLVGGSSVAVELGALDGYSIKQDERLLVYTSLRALFGAAADGFGDSFSLDQPLLLGIVVGHASTDGMSPSEIGTTVVVGGGGVTGGLASEAQGVGALALMGCADPNTKASFGSYRILSPVAVMDSYAGVVIGNVALTLAVGLLQAVAVCVLRVCRRVQRLIDLMSATRFPALFVAAAVAFHTGTVYACSQLVSQPGEYEAWEVAVGAVGFAYCVVLPFVLAVHPFLRVGRAFQSYAIGEWLLQRELPAWVVHVVPRGGMYSLETRRAYGGYVSAYQADAREAWWTSMPVWTGWVIGVGGLFHPTNVPGCQALFVCMGAAMVGMGCLVAWRKPLRSKPGVWLDAASRVCLGAVMFCMAAALVDDGMARESVAVVVYALVVVQLVLVALRLIHQCVCWYVDTQMVDSSLPLETVWTHIPGREKKMTQRFLAEDSEVLLELSDVAKDREDRDNDQHSSPLSKTRNAEQTVPNKSESLSPSNSSDSISLELLESGSTTPELKNSPSSTPHSNYGASSPKSSTDDSSDL